MYLSWVDPRARKAVAANMARLSANSSESCKLQCQLYPQNQQNPPSGCCDNVWVSEDSTGAVAAAVSLHFAVGDSSASSLLAKQHWQSLNGLFGCPAVSRSRFPAAVCQVPVTVQALMQAGSGRLISTRQSSHSSSQMQPPLCSDLVKHAVCAGCCSCLTYRSPP